MRERQFAGVKKGPAERRLLGGSVDPIAHNRMADGAQMQTDLMLASGVQFDFDQSRPRETLPHAIVGDGVTRRFVVIPGDVAFARFVFIRDRQVDGAMVSAGRTLNQGEITTNEGMISKRRTTRGVTLPRERDRNQARRAAI